jgi:hypothetical protein
MACIPIAGRAGDKLEKALPGETMIEEAVNVTA